MPSIRLKHQHPANERDFEILCLLLLGKHWNCPTLELYGHRGEKQDGIDILDTGGSEILRAAQCRLHDGTKTMSPAEIREAVAAARLFAPPLDEYMIMTTAKVSTKAQKEVLRINTEHRDLGLFKLELKTWDNIEILLDQYTDVRELFYGTARPSESLLNHTGASAVVQPVLERSESESIDGSIEEACAQLTIKRFQLARLLFQRIRQQKWHILSQRQKFRILSNIAVAHAAEGNVKQAIPLFLEAKTYQPDDERALANEVLAYLLGGKDATAFELATEARKKCPFSASILSYWIRTAPSEKNLDQLQREVPPLLEVDPDVCLALAERAMNVPDYGAAERLSELALKERPDWQHAKLVLAQSILAAESLKAEGSYGESALIDDPSRIKVAEQKLTEVIDALGDDPVLEIKVRALLGRSETRRFLGENELADTDILAAREILPNDPSVLCEHARILLNNDERQSGIAELRQAVTTSNHRQDTVMCLAVALAAGLDMSEREEAVRLFTELAGRPELVPPGVREHAMWTALQLIGNLNTSLPHSDILSQIPKGSISPTAAAAFCSKLALVRGQKDEASRYANEAIAAIVDSTTRTDVRILATLLSDLGRHNDALKLWQRIADYKSLNIDTRSLLDCATRLARHDVTLKTCEHLRIAGVDDADLVSHEAAVRVFYEPDRALEILQAHLTRHNDARSIRLQMFSYAIQLGKEELIKADRALLPAPEEVSALHWPLVVRVMVAGGNPTGALQYAYELLRNHYSEAEAHQAYIEALLPVETAARPEIDAFEEVQPGAAVCFVEANTTQEQWRIIEDVYKADERLGEMSPDHFLAVQLKGKRVGDTFLLAAPGVVRRTAVVKKILSKYVYRYQECIASFQVRFPAIANIEVVRVGPEVNLGTSQEMDLRPILSAVDIKEQAIEGALHTYASAFLSVNALATALGQSAFATMLSLAGRRDVKIKCCTGSAFERIQAVDALHASNASVLDLTAIATLSMLGLLDVLGKYHKTFIISRGTLLELEHLEIKERKESGMIGALGKHDGRYFLAQETEEAKTDRIKQLADLINSIKKSCSVLTCLQLAGLDPERRAALIKAFGQHGAESMALASEPGRVLWTDDYVVAHCGQKEFGVRRVWTQLFLQDQVESGQLAAENFYEASAKLIGCGYYFTGLNLPILLSTARISKGDPDQWPLNQVLKAFSDEALSAQDVFNLITQFFVEIFKGDVLAGQEAILVRTLERIADRKDGLIVIRALQKALPIAMGLNIIRAKAAEAIITEWLSTH